MGKHSIKLHLFITLLLLQGTVHGAEEWRESMKLYGAEIPKAGEIVTLKRSIENIAVSQDQLQKISGIVTKVCQKKGCWMILTDEDSHARITFKDYEFFVPATTGRVKAIVYGELTEAKLSERRAKHYAKDAGQSGENIKGSINEYSIVASGVYLEENEQNNMKE